MFDSLRSPVVVSDVDCILGLRDYFGSDAEVYTFGQQSAFHRLLNHIKQNVIANLKCSQCAVGAEVVRVSPWEKQQGLPSTLSSLLGMSCCVEANVYAPCAIVLKRPRKFR